MDFKDYISGKRSGKEANEIEQKSLEDAFLHDAIDGYDNFEDCDFSSDITSLESRINSPRRNKKKIVKYWAVVASIALIIAVNLYVFVNRNNGNIDISNIVKFDNNTVNSESPISPVENGRDPQNNDGSKQNFNPESTKAVESESPNSNQYSDVSPVELENNKNEKKSLPKSEKEHIKNSEYTLAERGELDTTSASVNKLNTAKIIEGEVKSEKRSYEEISASAPQKVFGETQFITYFHKNFNSKLYPQQNRVVNLNFYIDHMGLPSKIIIKNSPSDGVSKEVIRLLSSSPKWTSTNRDVILNINLSASDDINKAGALPK